MNGWRQRLLPGTSHVRWVLADQILVSGCNFFIAIILARALGPAAFGTYALITIAQQYFVSVSLSLIGNPLVTTVPHEHDSQKKAQLIASSFAAQLLLGSVMALLAAAGLSIYIALGATDISELAVIGVSISSFALPLLEWCRRLCFLRHEGAPLLRFDALTYLPVLIVAFFLAQSGSLTLDLAVFLGGASSIIAASYAASHLRMRYGLAGARTFIVKHWRIARDFIVSFQAQWLGSQGIAYLAAPVVGTAGIGAYRSIAGLLGFVNSVGTTLDNVFPIRFAEVYRTGGNSALRAYTVRFGFMLTSALLFLLLPTIFFANQIVTFLLGDAYNPYAKILWVQALYVFIIFSSRIALYHERARLNTQRIAVSALLGVLISMLSVIVLSSVLGPVGLAWSTVLGATFSLLYLSFGIVRDARRG
jgi:O-antigen/teichoic acid export membrane protein